jgi:hypothetical protein
MYSGEKDETVILFPINEISGGSIVESVWLDPCSIFNQPQGKSECVPGAISNSLKYLRDQYNLNLEESDINIEKMKTATDWNNGCTFGWWNKLEDYMEYNNYRIGIQVYSPPFDIDEIMQELSLGNCVELRACGHVASLIAVIKFSDGKYLFAIVHDTYQGPWGNGGEQLQFTIFDPVTNTFSGGKWINGRQLTRFIVQYPINEDPSGPDIDGPSNGRAGENYTYTFVSIDPDDDNLYYEIDWGDGNIDPWDGPYPSDAIFTKSYNWIASGTYIVRARAKDNFGGFSDWNSFQVKIPRGIIHNHRFLFDIFARFPFILKIFDLTL